MNRAIKIFVWRVGRNSKTIQRSQSFISGLDLGFLDSVNQGTVLCGRVERCVQDFSQNLKGRDQSQDLGVNGKMNVT